MENAVSKVSFKVNSSSVQVLVNLQLWSEVMHGLMLMK